MITPLSVQTLSLVDEGYDVRVVNDELKITKDGSPDDVRINCVYTKNEIDELIKNTKSEGPGIWREN